MIHFDIDHSTAKLDVPPEILTQVLQLLVTELKSALLVFEDQQPPVSIDKIRQAGHKVYGMAITIGLENMARLTREVANRDNTVSITERLVPEIHQEILLVINLVEQHLG